MRGCWPGEAGGWLTRNRASYVIGLESSFGFLLLVLSWKPGQKKVRKQQSLPVSWLWDERLLLASWAGYWRVFELEFYCYIWSGHCPCIYSISQRVFWGEDTGNTLDLWLILRQRKVQEKNNLCIGCSICKARILSMSWRIIFSTHRIKGVVVTLHSICRMEF